MFNEIELLIRLVVAVILGGIIGFERGGTKHAAGLRTHTILCLGAASVMVVSESLVNKYNIPSEIMRMGAQIISGVGFLGAGGIIISGGQLHGITTAAGLWTTACVGIAIGSGNYIIAIFVVILMMVIMLGLRSVSQKIRTDSKTFSLKIHLNEIDKVSTVLNRIIEEDLEISNTSFCKNDTNEIVMNVEFRAKKDFQRELIVEDILVHAKCCEILSSK